MEFCLLTLIGMFKVLRYQLLKLWILIWLSHCVVLSVINKDFGGIWEPPPPFRFFENIRKANLCHNVVRNKAVGSNAIRRPKLPYVHTQLPDVNVTCTLL